MLEQLSFIWLLAANFLALTLCGVDKYAAQHGRPRIAEIVLLLVALGGGSAGMLIGMHLFRHKTRKASFQVILVLILILQIALIRLYLL